MAGRQRQWRSLVVVALVLVLTASCRLSVGPARPTGSPSPPPSGPTSPTPTPSLTICPTPSPTPTLAPSLTPSPRRSLTPTPSPTSTPKPVPTTGPTHPPTLRPIAPSGPAAPLYAHGSRARPVIALTVDDCGSASATLALLAIFERERVAATWFPSGTNAVREPALWREIAAAGFPIANHTWSHADLTGLTYPQAVEQIRHDAQAVGAIIGRPLLPVLRPPYGAWDQAVLVAAAAAGQRAVVLWDTTFGDTGRGGVDQLIANAERGTNGSIVLMHANAGLTQQALPAVIAFYRARGLAFVTVGQLLGIPGSVPFVGG